jgi:hypothetical protein
MLSETQAKDIAKEMRIARKNLTDERVDLATGRVNNVIEILENDGIEV